MITPRIGRQEPSLARDLIDAARYYLWRPEALLALAAVAIVAGLALNWNWLVAAGIAPILISTLPCLIMCAFGVCMICRSGKEKSASAPDATTATPAMLTGTVERASSEGSSPVSLSGAAEPVAAAAPEPEVIERSAGLPSCCNGTSEPRPAQTSDLQPGERKVRKA